MGEGYWILLWDGWGSGLNMVNPRLLTINGENWWPCDVDLSQRDLDGLAIERHALPWLESPTSTPSDWPGGPYGSMPGVRGWRVLRASRGLEHLLQVDGVLKRTIRDRIDYLMTQGSPPWTIQADGLRWLLDEIASQHESSP